MLRLVASSSIRSSITSSKLVSSSSTSSSTIFKRISLSAPTNTLSIARRSFASSVPITNNVNDSKKDGILRKTSGSKSHLLGMIQNVSLAVLIPTAFFLPVPAVQVLANYGLAVMIPVHAQIGVSHVINDYVPRNLQGLAQKALLILTIISALGLIRLAHDGVGFSGAIKRLWSPNDEEDVE